MIEKSLWAKLKLGVLSAPLAVVCIACASAHSVVFVLTPVPDPPANAGSSTVAEADIERAAQIVGRVALAAGFKGVDPPSEDLARQLKDIYGYKEIASYRLLTGRRSVYLTVSVPNSEERISVVIRDFDHPDETNLTRRLKLEVDRHLRDEFAGYHIEVTESQIDASLAP